MIDELHTERPDLPIHALAVNEDGLQSGLNDLCQVSDLTVLQDDDVARVWERWNASWRDVVILGRDNAPYATFSLSSHTLTDPDDYAALKALFIEAAEAGE